jgi:hypothetical protein
MSFYQWWFVALSLINFILMIWTATVAFISNKHEKAISKIANNQKALEDVKNNHMERIKGIETQLKNMPEFKNMERLHEQLHTVDNKCAEMKGQLFGIEKKLSMIDKHLMDKK